MYMTTRAWMSFIMGQIGPELSLIMTEIAISDFVFTIASTNINQSAPMSSLSVKVKVKYQGQVVVRCISVSQTHLVIL